MSTTDARGPKPAPSQTLARIRARQRNLIVIGTVVVIGITLASLRHLRRR